MLSLSQKQTLTFHYNSKKFPSLVMLYLTDHSANCSLMPETDRI